MKFFFLFLLLISFASAEILVNYNDIEVEYFNPIVDFELHGKLEVCACGEEKLELKNTGNLPSIYSISGALPEELSLMPGKSLELLENIPCDQEKVKLDIRTGNVFKSYEQKIIPCDFIEAEITKVIVDPCDNANITLELKNTGKYTDIYRINEHEIELVPGQTELMEIQVDPGCSNRFQGMIAVESLNSGYAEELKYNLSVDVDFSYEADMHDFECMGENQFTLANTGNIKNSYVLFSEDFDFEIIELDPGNSTIVYLGNIQINESFIRVTPKFGEIRNYSFRINPVPCYRTETRLLSEVSCDGYIDVQIINTGFYPVTEHNYTIEQGENKTFVLPAEDYDVPVIDLWDCYRVDIVESWTRNDATEITLVNLGYKPAMYSLSADVDWFNRSDVLLLPNVPLAVHLDHPELKGINHVDFTITANNQTYHEVVTFSDNLLSLAISYRCQMVFGFVLLLLFIVLIKGIIDFGGAGFMRDLKIFAVLAIIAAIVFLLCLPKCNTCSYPEEVCDASNYISWDQGSTRFKMPFTDPDGNELAYSALEPEEVSIEFEGDYAVLSSDIVGKYETQFFAEDPDGGRVESPVYYLEVFPRLTFKDRFSCP